MRTFSPHPSSPLPQVKGDASSTHVSGKERKCQIAPHPLGSDGQPRTGCSLVAVKSPAFPFFPPAGFVLKKERYSVHTQQLSMNGLEMGTY